jgi:hypothetical protein
VTGRAEDLVKKPAEDLVKKVARLAQDAKKKTSFLETCMAWIGNAKNRKGFS